jgi:hypothetical protein
MNAIRESLTAALPAVAMLCAAQSAGAHHSDSLYFIDDRAVDGGAIRIEGTISRVRWINPHVEFFVDVPSASGEPTVWAIETDSVNQLRGLGWTQDTIKAGDEVVVIVSKSKFDDTAGRLRDMLVYAATPLEKHAVYLEYKANPDPMWRAPLELYRAHAACPGSAPEDPARQPGKETLLCVRLDANELAAARREFGDRVLLLRE